jgi:hypothetical protein
MLLDVRASPKKRAHWLLCLPAKIFWLKFKYIVCPMLSILGIWILTIIKPPLKCLNNAFNVFINHIQLNLPMWSPLLSSHLYLKVNFFLSCHRKFHVNWTSFKRSPVLQGHFFFVPKWPLSTGLSVYTNIYPSVPITTKVVSFNPTLMIQHYVIKFVSDLRQVGGFLLVLRFPSPIKLTAII